MSASNNFRGPADKIGTFYSLLRELEKFVDTSQLKIAFDKDQNAYLMGVDFTEQLQPQKTFRQEQAEMREIIARHVPRIHPENLSP